MKYLWIRAQTPALPRNHFKRGLLQCLAVSKAAQILELMRTVVTSDRKRLLQHHKEKGICHFLYYYIFLKYSFMLCYMEIKEHYVGLCSHLGIFFLLPINKNSSVNSKYKLFFIHKLYSTSILHISINFIILYFFN